MASHTVDDHGELVPRGCIHDRLRRLQKIVIALEWRDRECHTANLWAQHFNREPKVLLHTGCRLCMLPYLCYLVLSARLPCRDRVRGFVEEQVAVLSHNRLLADICRAVQEIMEVAVPPLTVLHPNHRLLGAELGSNTCRRTAGRTIAQLGLLQYSHAEATLCQSNGDKRAGCTTADDDDVLVGRGTCHN